VLLIGGENQKLGVMPISEALQLAQEQGLDLVEVAPQADPPVCRILDYGKYKYDQAKKEREARKHQRHVMLREVRMKVKIDSHDLDLKTRTAEKLLREGDKVKVSVMFRGREVTHPELGRGLLERIYEQLKDLAQIEKPVAMEGRFMNMILAPGHAKPVKETREAKETKEAPPAEEVSAATER
jgi:translation initiation factor IF-3